MQDSIRALSGRNLDIAICEKVFWWKKCSAANDGKPGNTGKKPYAPFPEYYLRQTPSDAAVPQDYFVPAYHSSIDHAMRLYEVAKLPIPLKELPDDPEELSQLCLDHYVNSPDRLLGENIIRSLSEKGKHDPELRCYKATVYLSRRKDGTVGFSTEDDGETYGIAKATWINALRMSSAETKDGTRYDALAAIAMSGITGTDGVRRVKKDYTFS